MTAANNRMAHVEQQLDSLDHHVKDLRTEVGELRGDVGELRTGVGELRSDVGELRTEVGELRGDVEELRTGVGGLRGDVGELRSEVEEVRGDLGTIKGDIQKLFMLRDVDAAQLQLIAEVQVQHSEAIEDIRTQLEPLRELPALMRTIAVDHENRIRGLEKRSRR